jgi:hypothetical protein
MVHVFCDESGGTAPRDSYFALGAVALEPRTASRAIKTFRKVAKITTSEIKGSNLTTDQRRLFVEVLVKEGGGRGAAVVCARGDQIADWAIGELKGKERILYRHMLAEVLELLRVDEGVHGITADKGRYKHTYLDQVAEDLSIDLERIAGRQVPFSYADSTAVPGLQIADVLCNIAGKLLSHGPHEVEAERALSPMIEQNLLVVRPLQLPRLLPEWLTLPIVSL